MADSVNMHAGVYRVVTDGSVDQPKLDALIRAVVKDGVTPAELGEARKVVEAMHERATMRPGTTNDPDDMALVQASALLRNAVQGSHAAKELRTLLAQDGQTRALGSLFSELRAGGGMNEALRELTVAQRARLVQVLPPGFSSNGSDYCVGNLVQDLAFNREAFDFGPDALLKLRKASAEVDPQVAIAFAKRYPAVATR